ncbi:16813_t:CDS:2, partial [Dentiscutata erythropus]
MDTLSQTSEAILTKFQYPLPQYVLGCLPALAVIGEIPTRGLWPKIQWIFRCLGLLDKEYFARGTHSIPFRPVGVHSMKFEPTESQSKAFSEAVAETSVLERLSSLISAYYILVGWAMAILKIVVTQKCNDWPYIPISLTWTLPVIYKRAVYGRLVFKDVTVELNKLGQNDKDEMIIQVSPLEPHDLTKKRVLVAIAAFISIVVPWGAVLTAYFTPPLGFFCRSRFISCYCTIWTFNGIISLILHLRGEVSLRGNRFVHAWFCICGGIVAMFFGCFCLLSDDRNWWVQLFGEGCDTSAGCN